MKRFKNLAVIVAMLLCGITQAFAETITLNDWTSTNHADNSTSSETYTFSVGGYSKLSFDWSVSSESNYDKLIVVLNGVTILTKSGVYNGTHIDYISSGEHTLKVQYTKDGSQSSGSDQATVSNICVLPFSSNNVNGILYQPMNSNTVQVIGVDEAIVEANIPSTVTIDEVSYSVIKIGANAFKDNARLSSITIPNSVTLIGDSAFVGCTGELTVDCNIPANAFSNAQFSKVVIGENVTSIGNSAFAGCSSLASIAIPASVTNINQAAFDDCTGLKEVTFADGNNTLLLDCNKYDYEGGLGEGLFFDCPLESLYLGRNLSYNSWNGVGYSPFYGKSSLKSVVIAEGVTSIRSSAFSGCTSLTSITIPEGVTSIGSSAFKDCSKLALVTIPGSVGSIGSDAFSGTLWKDNLADGVIYMGSVLYGYRGTMPEGTDIVVREGTTRITDSAFKGCNGLTSITIPESVTSIGSSAFYNCSSLASITIPEGVTSIGSSAFFGCSSLESIALPEGLTSIEYNTFYNCSSLASITIPEGVTSIGDYAFSYCNSLISINIPNSVTSVGYQAFCDCDNLSITLSSLEMELTNWLYDFYGGLVIRCDDIPNDAFKDFSFSKIVIGNNVKSIGNGAFDNCRSLKEIVFEDGSEPLSLGCNLEGTYNDREGYYETSGEGLFYDCPLETVYLGRDLEYNQDWGTGYSPFYVYDRYRLSSVGIGNTVTVIKDNIFYECNNLSSINISSIEAWCNITFGYEWSYGSNDNPLYYAKNLYLNGELVTDLVIPSTIKTINKSAFQGCTSLTSITIPESVASVGYNAFSGCSNLRTVNINSLEGWCNIDFSNLGSNPLSNSADLYLNGELITDLIIPNSVENIKSNTFRGCTGIETVLVPEGVVEIGNYVFSNCTGLTSISLPQSVKRIGYDAFENCVSLSSVVIPDSVKRIEDYTFSGCKNLTSVIIPENVNSIGRSAFSGCNSLESIAIPSSVTSIGNQAFSNGVKVVTLVAAIPPTLTSSNIISDYGIFVVQDNALSAYQEAEYWSALVDKMSTMGLYKREVTLEAMSKQSALHQALGDAALPYVVDLTINGTINSYDFMVMLNKMNRLRSLDLTNAHIVYNGYEHYTGYHTENNKLPAYAFYQKDLASVKLPQKITSIGSRAFSDCSGLASITIPESVKSVGSYAFYNCDGLMRVSLEGTSSIGSYAFSSCNSLSSVDMPEGVSSISDHAFSGCNKLVAFNVSKGVSSIGSYAFDGCSSLKDITIPKISGAINTYAFQNCSNLESFSVLDGSTSIGSYAFCRCSKLKDVSFDEVSTIGSYAFGSSSSYYVCANLASFTILKGLTSIGSYAFGYCTSLKDVNLPEGNISIGSNAFYYCSGLREINIPDGVTSIGSSAFTNCSGLKSIKLPTTLQTINSSAFSNCSSLAEVHIPSSVRNIHESAFSGCTNMKKVYVYTIEPTAISQNTFAMNSNNNFVGTLYAPKVSYYVYWYDTQWSQFEDIQPFDEPYDNFYLKGDLELNDSTGVVQGTEGEKPDAELGSNSGLVTDGNIDQELGDVEIEHDGTNGGSIVAGGNSSVEVDNLTFRITVQGGRWYFFCFPFDVRREDIKCENGADWVFRYYDGEERASNGKGGWKNVTSDGNGNHLKAATGYIFQCSKNDVLVLSAKNQKIKQEKKYNELVEHVTANMQDASWNFVGNPYLSYYDITGDDYSAPITIWDGSKYVAIRPGDDDYVLSPFEAFFVQKPEGVNDIEYDPEQQMTYYQMRMAAEQKAARRRTQTINPDRLLVNLTLSDTATTDRTRVVFNNEVSLDYEMDCDAAKFTTAGVPQIYTVGNRAVKYAINERPIAEGIVTVGYTAPIQGNYTLAAPRMDVSVYIKDNRTGILHDLSEGSYTFMTEAGTFEDRFVLMMKDDTTSIDKSQLINDEEAPIYNTKGQWVDEPSNQGVYIKDNRKVVKL